MSAHAPPSPEWVAEFNELVGNLDEEGLAFFTHFVRLQWLSKYSPDPAIDEEIRFMQDAAESGQLRVLSTFH